MPNKKNPYAVSVGERLAVTREKLGFRQTEFARLLGIDVQRLNNYEKGAHMLPPDIARLIFAKTRINADWLYLEDPTRLPADVYLRLFPSTETGAA